MRVIDAALKLGVSYVTLLYWRREGWLGSDASFKPHWSSQRITLTPQQVERARALVALRERHRREWAQATGRAKAEAA